MNAFFPQANTGAPRRAMLCAGIASALALASGVTAQQVAEWQFEKNVRPLLQEYCSKCHGDEKPKGDFHISSLSPSLKDRASRDHWATVLNQLKSGEMPPEDKPRPDEATLNTFRQWIARQLHAAAMEERTLNGRIVMRRLNRSEYEHTMCDLLGISTGFQEMLALDGASNGFDNVGSALHISSFALERYLEAGHKALNLAIANTPQPPLIKQRYDLKQQHSVKLSQEAVFRHLEEGVALFTSSPWTALSLSDFWPPDGGQYRIRISACAIQSDGKPVTYRVTTGELRGKNGLIGYFDAPPGDPTINEIVVRLEPRSGMAILPYGLPRSDVITKADVNKYTGPGLAVQWMEIEGPLHVAWPPASHVNLFGDLKRQIFPSTQINDYQEVVSENPDEDARRVLAKFLRRAFRRDVNDEDIAPYFRLFRDKLDAGQRFEESLRVALLAALVADDFLFIPENIGALDDFALATRLSYFLWSSLPDEELLKLAEAKQLQDPTVLQRQVDRLLADPKAAAFTENFTGQWLGLRNIDFTEPNHLIYPEFDHMLKVSMIRETELFFAEVLKNDLSLANFVQSDFSMLNGRLAKHYGIPGPDGWEFKRTALPEGCHRGGVMTMASVLKVTANGSYTHPVHRGVWILERILGRRPPNPPANTPVIEPDIRGTIGIRDQLAKHQQGSCAKCHVQIDPPGFALESFDVIGGWRDHYRSSGNGEEVVVDGQKMAYLRGQPVECADALPDGRTFQNIDEFKQLLLTDKDQLTRALTRQLITYATGAPAETVDEEQIEHLVAEIRAKHYGFKSLVHALVQSPLFKNK